MSCTHDPRELAGSPIGMYHCPDCGEMVVAGMAHAPKDTLPGCMLPDGADPCVGYQQLYVELLALRETRLALQIDRDQLLDRIGVLERRIEAKEILSSAEGGSKP